MRFTPKQGQYLAFIHYYTKLNECPPAEADMQRYFRVTPPTVHQMVLTLEAKALIKRTPRARTVDPPDDSRRRSASSEIRTHEHVMTRAFCRLLFIVHNSFLIHYRLFLRISEWGRAFAILNNKWPYI